MDNNVFNKKTQVLLLYPKTGMDLGSTVAPPHALLAVAAPLLKAGYRVKIIDQRTEAITEEVIKDELSGEPICIGITTMVGSQVYFALELAKIVRKITKGNVPIVWGGCLPSVIPEQVIRNENVDCVVVGEGDLTLLDLVMAYEHKRSLDNISGIMFKSNNKIIRTTPRALLDIENLLPVPWELVNIENYIHRDMYLRHRNRVLDIGQTSRGCPFNCCFCSSASIRQRKWRPMSVSKASQMIIETVKRFRLAGFWLRDDEFYVDRKRANEIFLNMIKADLNVNFYTSGTRCDVFMQATDEELRIMKRAGAYTLKFGVESGSQRILDLMQKGIKGEQVRQTNLRCKRHGINPAYAFIIGYPTETFKEIEKTIDLSYLLRRDYNLARVETIVPYTALPGTPGWPLALEHGLRPPAKLEEWADWVFDDYDFEGRKAPWIKERRHLIWIMNITYMSIISNCIYSIVSSIRNLPVRWFLQMIAKPIGIIYSVLLENKFYRLRPELTLFRYIRKKIFYQGFYTIK